MKTILLAEPDIDLRENMIELLSLVGYSVITLSENLHECDISKFDGDNLVCLMDQDVPYANGTHEFDTFIDILVLSQIPIIILSDDPDDVSLVPACGQVSLPFEPEELLKVLGNAFEKNHYKVPEL